MAGRKNVGRRKPEYPISRRNRVRVQLRAVNRLSTRPMPSVSAKPFTNPVPKAKSAAQLIRPVTCPSRIEEKAREKPARPTGNVQNEDYRLKIVTDERNGISLEFQEKTVRPAVYSVNWIVDTNVCRSNSITHS